jgi:hypothetical protein
VIATESIRLSIRLLFLSVRTVLWSIETTWIGAVACVRGAAFALRAKHVLAKATRCPRGHRVELYGVHRCGRCQAAFEGHALDPCPICGAKARFLACLRCGLAVRNPLR